MNEDKNKDKFYCYSLRLYHFICSFGGKYESSGINHITRNRYWVFKKSEELDRIIEFYNSVKHKFYFKSKDNE